jgi:hypothetical protein
MKLHEVPNQTWVKVKSVHEGSARTPPGAPAVEDQQVIFFDHLDGMFSYCKDLKGNVVHLIAWAEVEVSPIPMSEFQDD